MNTAEFIHHHGAQAEHTARAFLDRARPAAHVRFADPFDFGAAGIACAEIELLERAGIEVTARYEAADLDAGTLRRALGDEGTVVFSGGRDFGDLGGHHARRLEIIRELGANPVVQLPQSSEFQRGGLLDDTVAALESCADVTLMAREATTCAAWIEHFASARVRVISCPDIAFVSGGRERPLKPSFDIVALLRTDAGSRYHREGGPTFGEVARQRLGIGREGNIRISGNAPGGDVITAEVDVLCDEPGSLLLTDWPLTRIVEGEPAWNALAFAARVRLGRDIADRILSRARVVITDRLHAHVFALQLGIPHVLVDDRYGTLSSYYRTWTRHCDGVRFADTLDDALDKARAFSTSRDQFTSR